MKVPMIRSWQGANAHNPYESAFIKVPGAWVPAVVSLVRILGKHRRTGLIVTNIGRKSAAANAGMVRGDLLLKYGDTELHKSSTLRRLTVPYGGVSSSEKRVTIKALRGGKEMNFEVPEGPLGITVSAMFRHLVPGVHRKKQKHTGKES
jgi:S1-C subfamily serine protease